MSQECIVKITHGSYLFGTNIETSDLDVKSVMIPSIDQILLGEVNWSEVIDANDNRPNTKDDIDDERHDLLRFMRLLQYGQPVALEMLFAPDKFHHGEAHPVWREMQNNTDLLVPRNAQKFFGFARQQALDHGAKGERIKAAEKVQSELDRLIKEVGHQAVLRDYMADIIKEVASPHISEVFRQTPHGAPISHLKIANKLAAATIRLDKAKEICDGVVAGYRHRSSMSCERNTKDFKALSHAIRIGNEAVELLQTGFITLPRPEAPYLLEIRLGKVDSDKVGEELMQTLEEIDKSYASSPLREEVDEDFMNEIVKKTYGEYVIEEFKAKNDFSLSPT